MDIFFGIATKRCEIKTVNCSHQIPLVGELEGNLYLYTSLTVRSFDYTVKVVVDLKSLELAPIDTV